MELQRTKRKLCRRQDLPPRAFFTLEDGPEGPGLETLLSGLDAKLGRAQDASLRQFGKLFVALSYRWLDRDNPDPNGFHLKRVADAARLYITDDEPDSLYHSVFAPLGYKSDQCDFALFWDFASMFQGKDRTEGERALFREGLKLSNVWYGHRFNLIWMETALPSKFAGQTYDSSGWCYVEASLSSVLKPSAHRLDLGKHQMWDKTYAQLRTNGLAGRMPPVLPEEARRQITKNKKVRARAGGSATPLLAPFPTLPLFPCPDAQFTNDHDKEPVIKLYETFFSAIQSRLKGLHLPGLGWGDEQARVLCQGLERFDHLEELDVRNNHFGDIGMGALLNWLRPNASLAFINGLPTQQLRGRAADSPTLLDWAFNDADGDEVGPVTEPLDGMAVQIIGALVEQNTRLTSLSLAGHPLGDAGGHALAAVLHSTASSLRELDLSSTQLGDLGARPLFNALGKNSTLTALSASGNSRLGAAIEDLGTALRSNTTLETLDVRGCATLKHSWAHALVDGLLANANSSVTQLWLERSEEYWHTLRGGGVVVGGGATTLDLTCLADGATRDADNQLHVGDSVLIGALLPTCPSLLTLDLSGSPFGGGGEEGISRGLVADLALTTLTLAGCALGDSGTIAIAKALLAGGAPMLTVLDLSDNQVQAKGASHVGLYLAREPRTLERLALSHNEGLGDDGVEALFKRGELSTNASLKRLELEYVFFGKRGAIAITDALQSDTCFIEAVSCVGFESLVTYMRAPPPSSKPTANHNGKGHRRGSHDVKQDHKVARVRKEQIESAVSLLEGNEFLRAKVTLRTSGGAPRLSTRTSAFGK